MVGRRRSYGDAADRQRDRANGGLCPRPLSCLRFSCARARPRGRRFRSGGAGIELWGSFGARRSKPLAAGGRVNRLALGFLARAGSRGGIAFWSGAGARGAAVFFFFGFSPPASATGSTATSAPSRARGYTALTISPPFLVRARGRPRGQRFRSGGAGIELWGSFGARRSKPLAAGWVYGVCSLWIFRLESPARGLRLYPLAKVAAEAGGRRRWSSVIPIPPRRDKIFVGCDPT